MGRDGWSYIGAFLLAVFMASCGGTGGGPSNSGQQFVFTPRGQLNLAVQTTSNPLAAQTTNTLLAAQTTSNSDTLILTATLLDPQGVPFRNSKISFTADFPDATFIPGNDNTGSVITDDNGRGSIMLVAGATTGKMRVLAEAPPELDIATGATVTLTEQGFISLGPLDVIPDAVTFVNPAP